MHNAITSFCVSQLFTLHVFYLGQVLVLRVEFIFKVCEAQSCLMVAWWFHQVTFVSGKYNNFQDSKSIFMINEFKFSQ